MTVTIDAKAVLDLFARQGELVERTHSLLQRTIDRPLSQPVYSQREATDIAVAATDLVLALGGPMQGLQWELRTLITGGVTFATAAAGTAVLVRSASRPRSAAAVGLPAVLDQAASLPLPAGYGTGQIVIRYPEKLYVIVVGGTAGQQYVTAGSIVEFQEGVRTQTVGT